MAAQRCRRGSLFLRVVRLRVCGRQADRSERHRAEGRRRLSRHARGWLRLGKTFQRTHVPAFPRRLRPRRRAWRVITMSTGRTAPRRRPRKSAGGDLPQSDRGEADRQTRDRDLGRRPANPQLHVYRRLREGHADDHRTATFWSRSTSAAANWSRSTSWSTSSKTSPA